MIIPPDPRKIVVEPEDLDFAAKEWVKKLVITAWDKVAMKFAEWDRCCAVSVANMAINGVVARVEDVDALRKVVSQGWDPSDCKDLGVSVSLTLIGCKMPNRNEIKIRIAELKAIEDTSKAEYLMLEKYADSLIEYLKCRSNRNT